MAPSRALLLALLASTPLFAGPPTSQWQASGGGNWFTNSNWQGNAVPNSNAAANIATAGVVSTAGAANDVAVNALNVGASNAQVLFDFPSASQRVNLGNGTSAWTAGNVEVRNSAGIFGSGLANTTLNISPGVELLFSTGGLSRSLDSLTVSNAGTVHTTSGVLSITSAAITNAAGGLIHADGAEIDFDASTTLQNLGIIRATGATGIVSITSTVTTANLGSVELVNGGRAYLKGLIDNSGVNNAGATLNAPTGGSYELEGGTISGGTVADGAVTFTSSGGALQGATLAGNLTLPANAQVSMTNGATFAGPAATLNAYSSVLWQQSGTLDSKALTFGTGAVFHVNNSSTLTLGSRTTASGQVTIQTDSSAGSSVTNYGTITHTQGYGVLGGSWLNAGNISALNGSYLDIGFNTAGSATNDTTGSITATGATVNLQTSVVNKGTMSATNSGSLNWRGSGASVNSGNVTVSSDSYIDLGLYNSGSVTNDTTGTLTADAGVLYLDGSFTNKGQMIARNNATISQSSGTFLNSGSITSSAGASVRIGNYSSGVATNDTNGVIVADNGTVNFNGDVINNGQLLAKNGGNLVFYGYGNVPTLTSHLGAIVIDASGGHAQFTGQVTNDAAGGLTAPTGGSYELAGATISGGTVGARALTYTNWGGTLAGVTVADDLTLPASSQVALESRTTTNAGTVTVTPTTITGGNITLNQYALLEWNQSGSLDGKTIVFGQGSSLQAGDGTSLTFGPTTSATGQISITPGSSGGSFTNKGTITHTSGWGYVTGNSIVNSGTIRATAAGSDGQGMLMFGSFTNGTATNDVGGTLVADGGSLWVSGNFLNNGSVIAQNGGTVALQLTSSENQLTLTNAAGATIAADGAASNVTVYGPIQNNGTLRVRNGGTISLQNWYSLAQTSAQLGSAVIESTGGHVQLGGLIDNSNATLAKPTGGSFELAGGTISNGNIADGALTYTDLGGTLNGVKLQGNVSLPAYSHVVWSLSDPSATNAVATRLDSANAVLSLGNNAALYLNQGTTLTGNTVQFAPSSQLSLGWYATTSGSEPSGSMPSPLSTVGLTIDPSSKLNGAVSITTPPGITSSLVNQGTILHNDGDGYLSASSITNAGTITIASGNLHLGLNTGGSGTMTNQAGATIRLNGGNLMVQSTAGNPLVNYGTITGAGLIGGNVTLSGGTLAPGNNGIGTMTFTSGTLNIAAPTTFAFDLDGAHSDQIVFQNPGMNVDLGSGLVALSINLLSAPTANTTFNLISITPGYSLTGRFANLGDSGTTLTANFGGTAFTFSINYQPNLVALSYTPVVVPEPSEYALMFAGLGVLGAGYWRRRRRA